MKLSKDKTSLIYNKFQTLSDIPKEAYEYRLGNRSALESKELCICILTRALAPTANP